VFFERVSSHPVVTQIKLTQWFEAIIAILWSAGLPGPVKEGAVAEVDKFKAVMRDQWNLVNFQKHEVLSHVWKFF
jgi:hypothetical protein